MQDIQILPSISSCYTLMPLQCLQLPITGQVKYSMIGIIEHNTQTYLSCPELKRQNCFPSVLIGRCQSGKGCLPGSDWLKLNCCQNSVTSHPQNRLIMKVTKFRRFSKWNQFHVHVSNAFKQVNAFDIFQCHRMFLNQHQVKQHCMYL